jgi:hypothetical protein
MIVPLGKKYRDYPLKILKYNSLDMQYVHIIIYHITILSQSSYNISLNMQDVHIIIFPITFL